MVDNGAYITMPDKKPDGCRIQANPVGIYGVDSGDSLWACKFFDKNRLTMGSFRMLRVLCSFWCRVMHFQAYRGHWLRCLVRDPSS